MSISSSPFDQRLSEGEREKIEGFAAETHSVCLPAALQPPSGLASHVRSYAQAEVIGAFSFNRCGSGKAYDQHSEKKKNTCFQIAIRFELEQRKSMKI